MIRVLVDMSKIIAPIVAKSFKKTTKEYHLLVIPFASATPGLFREVPLPSMIKSELPKIYLSGEFLSGSFTRKIKIESG